MRKMGKNIIGFFAAATAFIQVALLAAVVGPITVVAWVYFWAKRTALGYKSGN